MLTLLEQPVSLLWLNLMHLTEFVSSKCFGIVIWTWTNMFVFDLHVLYNTKNDFLSCHSGQQTTSNTVLNTCCCLFKNIYGDITDAQIIERIKMNLLAIQANLAINKDILSRTIRTKTCANDDRISSKIYGYFAGFIIGFILFLICISDISNLAKLALNHSRKTKRLQTDSSYTFWLLIFEAEIKNNFSKVSTGDFEHQIHVLYIVNILIKICLKKWTVHI